MVKDKVTKVKKAAPAVVDAAKDIKKKAAFISLEDKDAVKTKKAKTPYSDRRAICYVSHLPHGFYEKQLREYLGQFGAITNLRLGRSTKTGGSKGYAFVEFKYPEVAKIVSETMNNYLMFDKLVKCEVIPAEKMSKACFRGKVNPDNPPSKVARYDAKKNVNALRTEEQNNSRLKKQIKKLEKVKAKLEAAGMTVDMEFESVAINKKKSKSTSAKGTPLMEVDTDENEIKMKTPPNVRKVKSRGNSAAATPVSSKNTTPAATAVTPKMKKAAAALEPRDPVTPKMKKAAAALEPRDLVMQQVAEKLKAATTEKKGTPKRLQQQATPKSDKKGKPKAQAATPKGAKKGTPKVQTPKVQTPKVQTPKPETPKPETPKSAKKSPKQQTPKPETPKSNKKNKTPQIEQVTPKSAKKGTPKVEKVTPKSAKKAQQQETPKSGKKGTPKVEQVTPKSGKKGTPKSAMKSPAIKTPKSGKKKA